MGRDIVNSSGDGEEIRHLGTVESVEKGRMVRVRITDAADCSACAASALCGISGRKGVTVVKVPLPSGVELHPGDNVELSGTERLHKKAIRLATVYPTLAILAVMTGMYLLTGNQLVAALAGIGVMVLFFVVLWLARNRLAHEFSFTISCVLTDV